LATVSTSASYIIGVDSYDPAEAGSYTLTISPAGSATDVGPKLDTLKKDSGPPPPDGPTGAVKIVITEIMANPGAVGDDKGEWFEVYNAGTTTVNLKGWKLKEAPPATAAHTIATDVLVPRGPVQGTREQRSDLHERRRHRRLRVPGHHLWPRELLEHRRRDLSL
jgi:hypothetical protein